MSMLPKKKSVKNNRKWSRRLVRQCKLVRLGQTMRIGKVKPEWMLQE